MNKFLSIVEQNLPEKDLDKLTGGKNELARLLFSIAKKAGMEDELKPIPVPNQEVIKIVAGDKTYIVELKDVIGKADAAEDQEDIFTLTSNIAKGGGKNSQRAGVVLKKLQDAEPAILNAADRQVDLMKRKATMPVDKLTL